MDPFMSEVRIFGFGFAPRGWAQCNGALLPIAQFTAIFSLIGTSFGGDGRTTFGLPNFTAGRSALGAGAGPGLTPRLRGETGGALGVQLTTRQLPAHTHALSASATPADNAGPDITMALGRSTGQRAYAPPGATTQLEGQAIGMAPGSAQPHNNLMPFQVLNFCFCLDGLFPQRP